MGLKYISVYPNEFVFQQVLMNAANTKVENFIMVMCMQCLKIFSIFHPLHNFVPEIWNDYNAIDSLLNSQSHKSHYIQTVLAYISSLQHMLYLWHLRVLDNNYLSSLPMNATHNFYLQGLRIVIFNQFKSPLLR